MTSVTAREMLGLALEIRKDTKVVKAPLATAEL